MSTMFERFPTRLLGILAGAALVSACTDSPTTPGPDLQPSFAAVGSSWYGIASCPANPDVVVTDRDELFDALADAEPGDVIGVDGMIELDESVPLEQDGVTLTCATLGSGFLLAPGSDGVDLVDITAADVTVSRLMLDATGGRRAFRARNTGTTEFARGTTLTLNDVFCGSSACLLFAGVEDVLIGANRFVALEPALTGVHIQGHGPFADDGSRPRTADNARVFYNVIIAEAPSVNQAFGGIRIRDGRNLNVTSNSVLGPWQNSVSVDDVQNSRVDQNELHDPQQYGILMGFSSPVVAGARGNAMGSNSITGADDIGIWMVGGCYNQLVENQLVNNGTDGVDGIRFSEDTGGNVYVGDLDVVDAEAGEFDCDGDGVTDPNILIAG